ncbi:MAG: cytidine deaminase [Moheibacter sp.]
MKKITYKFDYQEFENTSEVSKENLTLINKAKEIAYKAYAPFSKFRVGATVLLKNGTIYSGNNQENASFPAGICAERALLSYIHGNFPDEQILKIAISVLDANQPISPCGICRQSLLEYELVQNQTIEIILHNASDSVLVIPSASSLLPIQFDSKMLP